MINENLKAKGELTISLFDETGNKYFEKTEKNLVVLVGREWIVARMKDTGIPAQITHMEIGQGTTAPVAGNTTIQIPFAPQARVAVSVPGGTVSSNTISYTATFPAGTGTGTVTEAALFNNNLTGTMLCRTVFPAIGKVSTDSMAIQWTVSILA